MVEYLIGGGGGGGGVSMVFKVFSKEIM